jgi:signal peptidase complex subunit 3
MHSFWQRLNAIFFFTLSMLGFLAFLSAMVSYGHTPTPQVEMRLERILLRKIYGAGHDQAILSLGINADLRTVFNWNVKQLFVYITAEYETEANVLNQVVVWDSIITDEAHAWIRSDFVVNKYSLTDQGYGLRDNNVTLVMNWNTVPATGLLTLHHAFSDTNTFQVPDVYA